jgi:uncharacterized repeat protein (TIGR01451 family)
MIGGVASIINSGYATLALLAYGPILRGTHMKSRIKYWFLAICLGILPVAVFAFLLPRPVAAAGPWYVAPGGNDSNDCQAALTPCATINGAIAKSADGDTINVAVGTYTANSGYEVVLITRSVALEGGWNNGFTTRSGRSTIDGQGARRGMFINNLVSVTVERLVFQNGSELSGGGVFNEGNLTLIQSLVIHNSNAVINNGGGIFSSGDLTVTSSLVGYNSAVHNGGGVYANGNVTIISSTIVGNQAGTPGDVGEAGGGIFHSHGELLVKDSAISGNMLQGGSSGAGINSAGLLTVFNSTISGNHGGLGEGISSDGGVALFNTTISGNSGTGLRMLSGSATFENSIISGNGSSACAGSVNSQGYNLVQPSSGCGLVGTDVVSLDARLDRIQENGGPALTQALLPGSPAINAGNPSGCSGPIGLLVSDSRGYPRLGRCDIGAYEAQPVEFAEKTVNAAETLPGASLDYRINVGNGGPSPISNILVTDTLPAGVSYTIGSLSATSGSASFASGVIKWTGTVTPGGSVTIDFSAVTAPNLSIGTVITNKAIINGDGELLSRSATTTLSLAKLFLPLINKPLAGIQGYVTLNGAPVAFVTLELRRFNGQAFSTELSTSTDSQGFYNFASASSLGPGEIYYVRYLNDTNPGFLSYWGTADITTYTAGGSVAAGNFDIADVALQAPPPGANVSLPTFFQWAVRPATPSDSYQLALFDPDGDAYTQSGLLGYVNSVNVGGVPSDFHSGTPYGWYININSPDGGVGTSYYYRLVTFTNALAGSQPSVDGGVILEAAKARADGTRP